VRGCVCEQWPCGDESIAELDAGFRGLGLKDRERQPRCWVPAVDARSNDSFVPAQRKTPSAPLTQPCARIIEATLRGL
jgi:hypothetical protein